MCRFFADNAISLYDSLMLLRFRCKNFRSIREEQTLSLIAAKTRADEKSESLIGTPIDDLKLLRCAAIYGPNASGKSNVLTALSAFRETISYSQRLWKPNGPIPTYDPFLLDDISRGEQTEFEATFVLDSTIYKYGFRFNQSTFHQEWLLDRTGKDKRLFERKTLEGATEVTYPNRNLRHLRGIELDVRPNSLFLSAAAQRNHPVLSKLYAYLSDSFRPIDGNNLSARQRYTAEMCQDKNRNEQIRTMMKFADVGINDLEISKRDMPETEKRTLQAYLSALKETDPDKYSELSTGPSEFPKVVEVRMAHQGAEGKNYFLDGSRESDGTRAYFSILGPLISSLQNGTVLLIDELESSMHPMLARELLRIFNSPDLNPNGTQVIFTTHSTSLLDLDLLRRDQVWFTEKNGEGATVLHPLSDYLPRPNQNIEAGYLGGRFNALAFHDPGLLREEQRLLFETPHFPESLFEEYAKSNEGI